MKHDLFIASKAIQPEKNTQNQMKTQDQYRTAETTIAGFSVSFEFDPALLEEGGATQCYIEGHGLSGSLCLLDGTGCLSDEYGNDTPIHENAAQRIIDWAHAQGY